MMTKTTQPQFYAVTLRSRRPSGDLRPGRLLLSYIPEPDDRRYASPRTAVNVWLATVIGPARYDVCACDAPDVH